MTKTIDTLVEDIQELFNPHVDQALDIEALQTCLQSIGEAIENSLQSQGDRAGKLRLSQVGKPDRQVWLEYHGEEGEDLQPDTYIKFLIGHVWEALVLFMAKQAGHEVRGEQDECEIEGVKGHRDAVIDNVLVDVKSAATFSFNKFKDGSIATDNTFGYPLQLASYLEGNDDCDPEEAAWVAVDKQHGHMAVAKVKRSDLPDARERVKRIKKVVNATDLPPICYLPEADGKSGNLKLAVGCSYCKFKRKCFPKVRTFLYSTGPRYLVNVAKMPKVPEIMNDGTIREVG